MPQKEYTISVAGQKFVFTKGQLESEPGNYFLDYFFGSFREGETQRDADKPELVLYSDLQLFKVIDGHLRGYDVLPISAACIPANMTEANALKNLKKDALYYGLGRLEKLVDEVLRVSAPGVWKPGSIQATNQGLVYAPKKYKIVQSGPSYGPAETNTITEEGYAMYLEKAQGQNVQFQSAPSQWVADAGEAFTLVIAWMEKGSGYRRALFASN